MSECVVRMEMPKGCGYCPIANFGYCSINHKQVGDPLMGYPENRPANCPIICQLPEGHGRLIDASTIIGEVDAGYTDDYGNQIPANRPISVDEYLGLRFPPSSRLKGAKHEAGGCKCV